MTTKTNRTGPRAARQREVERLVRAQERSGLTQREFCEIHGVALRTFAGWRSKLSRSGECDGGRGVSVAENGFFEVEIVDDVAANEAEAGIASTAAPGLEICLPSGVVIRVPHETPEPKLRSVLSMVGVPC